MMSASDFIGHHFRQGARGPTHFYCWSLVETYLEKMHGLTALPLYDGDNHAEIVRDALLADDWVQQSVPKAGDVVVMLTPIGGGKSAPMHIGVMVDDSHVLHIDRGSRSECLSVKHPLIAMRLHGFWRHKDLI
jgi:cell wall-associated NlpC family hydrolase